MMYFDKWVCCWTDEDEMADFVRRIGQSELFEEMKVNLVVFVDRHGLMKRCFAETVIIVIPENWQSGRLNSVMWKKNAIYAA